MKRAATFALLAVLVVAGTLSAARAQEPTSTADAAPTPAGPAITLHDAEMLFPSGVRFGLIVTTTPENLERATLTLSQEGGPIVTVPVNVQSLAIPVGENLARVDYVRPINPALTFAPLSTVSYRWTLTTADGETLRVDGEFIFRDAIRTLDYPAIWRGIEGPIALYTHNPSLALDVVQAAILRAYERVKLETGLDQSFRFILYDPDVAFCLRDAAGLYIDSPTIGGVRLDCDPRAVTQIYAGAGYSVLQRDDFTLEALEDQLVRHIVATLYDQLWAAESGDGPPAWFREGLFQLYGLTAKGWTLPLVRDAARSGALLSLADLQQPESAPDRIRLWRAQSYLLTLYLAARFGADTPFELARTPLDEQTFDGALEARFDITPAQLYDDWRAWLLRDEAAAALRWTPYLTTTATPAPSVTPSPTRTPTSSVPSATPPPTATDTPFPARTNSPIPPRSTNTPRPPGGALRPTPTSAPPPSGSGLCGAPALVVLPLAGFFWIRVRKRRV